MASLRTALVTGASAGIGVAYAQRLAQQGYSLVLTARRKDRLEALAQKLTAEHGVRAEAVAADLTQPADVRALESRLASDASLALVVNNAGFGGYRPFHEQDVKVIDDLLSVHIQAVTRLTRAALPGMVARKAGAVINVASLLALSGTLPPNPMPYRAVYAGAKAYLVTFTQALAGELAQTGVRVQVCLPGIVATEFHTVQGLPPFPTAMAPQDVVTASLVALERNEVTCVPGLEDPAALEKLAEGQRGILMAANRGGLAARYR